MNKLDKMKTILDRIEELREQMRHNEDRLRVAVELMELFGSGIFDHGAITTHVIGNINDVFTFVLTMGNDEEIKTDLANVPVNAWPTDTRIHIRWQRGSNANKYKRLVREFDDSRRIG